MQTILTGSTLVNILIEIPLTRLNDLERIENKFGLVCSWTYAHVQQKQMGLYGVTQTCKYIY